MNIGDRVSVENVALGGKRGTRYGKVKHIRYLVAIEGTEAEVWAGENLVTKA